MFYNSVDTYSHAVSDFSGICDCQKGGGIDRSLYSVGTQYTFLVKILIMLVVLLALLLVFLTLDNIVKHDIH